MGILFPKEKIYHRERQGGNREKGRVFWFLKFNSTPRCAEAQKKTWNKSSGA
jgi:hypothetical protein